VEIVLQAILIGILQGVTEFVPVSSSAHLELAPWIAGWGSGGLVNSLAFDVFLHLGTLLALVGYFARDWARLITAWWASVRERRIAGDPQRRMAWLLVLATVPAALIGFVGEDLIDQALHAETTAVRLAIAGFLVLGAAALWLADRYGSRSGSAEQLSVPGVLAIGLSQAAALLPGISRSGATMATGLALGLTREAAARFAFLLATPITLGAGVYGSRHLLVETHTGIEWLAIAAGLVAAALAGWATIGLLLAWLRTRSVNAFVVYRVAFAALIVGLVLAGR